MIRLYEIAKALEEHQRIVILTHENPDGDTLGSAFALYYALTAMGKQVRVENCGPIPTQFSYLTADYRREEFEPDWILAVDVADVKLLGSLRGQYEGKIDCCIDHHRENRSGAKECYLESTSASTCELIWLLLQTMDAAISPMVADCLFTGVITDTGCFQFSNTTARTHRIAAHLMELTPRTPWICRRLFGTKSKARLQVEKQALEQMVFYRKDTVAFLTISLEQQKGITGADLDGITSIPRSVEGVLIGVVLKQKDENSYKVSMRSIEPYDVSAICKQFGGGGHACAAGCLMQGTAQEITKRLLDAISKAMNEVEV